MSKHTPGPWFVAHELGDFRTERVYAKCEGHVVTICEARKDELPVMLSMAAWGSNAKLIAAAPELLSALKDFVQTCENLSAQPTINENFALIHARAIKAIAKAEGEE